MDDIRRNSGDFQRKRYRKEGSAAAVQSKRDTSRNEDVRLVSTEINAAIEAIMQTLAGGESLLPREIAARLKYTNEFTRKVLLVLIRNNSVARHGKPGHSFYQRADLPPPQGKLNL